MKTKIVNVSAERIVKQEIEYIPQEDFDRHAKYTLLDRRYGICN